MKTLLATLFAACMVVAVACGAGTPTPAQQLDVSAWTAADARCEANSATRPALDACYDANRRLYCGADGGLLADSGACSNVRLSNGGTP